MRVMALSQNTMGKSWGRLATAPPSVSSQTKTSPLVRVVCLSLTMRRWRRLHVSYAPTCLGYNFRLDDIRASIAIEQLKKLPKDLVRRIEVRKRYLNQLSGISQIAIPFANNKEFVSNYIMPIVLLNSTRQRRNQIRDFIHANGIQTSVHYPAVHRFSTFEELGAVLPQTDYVTDNEITLPMYAALTDGQIDFICETVKKAVATL